jgi:hypothetical protein
VSADAEHAHQLFFTPRLSGTPSTSGVACRYWFDPVFACLIRMLHNFFHTIEQPFINRIENSL